MLSIPILPIGLALLAPVVGDDLDAEIVAAGSVEDVDDETRRARAVAAFESGKEAFAAADYFEALASFKLAQELAPTPELHYDIGLCHERVDNWDRAIESFEAYLQEVPDAYDRADVESRIAAARRRKSKEAQAEPEPPPMPATLHEPRPIDSSIADGSMALTPSDEGLRARPHRGLVAGGSTLLALGAAGAIGGGVGLGFVKQDDVTTTTRWATVGAGGAIAVTGAVLMGVGLRRRARARDDRTAFAPHVGPSGAGITLTGRF